MALEMASSPVDTTAYGEIFTRRWVVDVLLDLARYTTERDLSALHLVEPSCGSGAFLLPSVERLLDSLGSQPVDRARIAGAIQAWDIQAPNVASCREAVHELLKSRGYKDADCVWLSERWVRLGDYLLDEDQPGRYADVIVGNPPYVRLEDVSDDLQARYRARWKAMGGRADLYVGFFEKGLKSLKDGGRLAFICADRWMRNQYGGALRGLVAANYSIDAVWTMHDVDAFESLVSAYPAITVMSRQAQGSAVVADTTADFGSNEASDLAKWTTSSELLATDGKGYQAYRLPHWFPGNEMWPTGSPDRLALIEQLADRFPPLHDPEAGTRVGIGIATGADQIFLTKDANLVEPDRLLPMAMVADTRSGQFKWGGKYLVNPWTAEGQPVDLELYPRLAAYFESHHEQLGRRYIARGGKRWYQTIDKVNHGLTAQPKLLIADMRTTINPVLDTGGTYPHHNLYFVASTVWDMEVLGGLLLSRVAQAFIEAYCVRMRGGTLRFQAQYLKKIRVPHPENVGGDVQDALREAFRARDVAAATRAALDAYKLDPDALDH